MFERSKPKRLRPGMRIGVVAPSSPVLERSRIDRGVARLERLGFQVVLGEHALDSYHTDIWQGRIPTGLPTCCRCWRWSTWMR